MYLQHHNLMSALSSKALCALSYAWGIWFRGFCPTPRVIMGIHGNPGTGCIPKKNQSPSNGSPFGVGCGDVLGSWCQPFFFFDPYMSSMSSPKILDFFAYFCHFRIPGSGNWLPRLGLAAQHHRGHGRSGGSALHLVPGIRKQGSHAVCTITVDAGVFRVKDVQIDFSDVCLDLYVSDCESLDISWYLCRFLIRFDVFSCFLAIWAATDAHFFHHFSIPSIPFPAPARYSSCRLVCHHLALEKRPQRSDHGPQMPQGTEQARNPA